MIVLDAYALIAYLRGEPAADDVAEILRRPSVISAVTVAEVLDQLVRVHGRDADDVHGDLAVLTYAGMQVAAVTTEIGLTAGRLRARHYHRSAMPVSLADCIAASTALSLDTPLATADPDLAAMLRAAGGQVHGLVDTSGRLP